ncbi:hypothetical protein JKH05_001658 [Salmonella enterica]|nr:hypothetical protein [Salmonella enterica]EHA1938100.1 hypothetical protein [Salmonella enterica]
MITLRRLNEIAITRGNDICIIDKERQYTWYDIIRRTESRIVFLRRAFNPEQLRSVCYLSKNSVDLICWLAAFATLGIPANGLDYSLPIETLRGLLIKINPGLMLVSFSLYSPDELNKLHVRTITMLAVDAPTDPVIGSIGEFHHPELESLLATHIPAPFRSVSLTSGTSSAPKIVLRYNYVGNRIITPTNGVLFMDVVPITAFIVSALNGVVPTNMQIIGAVITAMALVLNNLNQRKLAMLATQANTLKASTSH